VKTKRKLDISDKKQRDYNYDHEKMNRSFHLKWESYENEKMFCTLCVKFPDLSGGMACSFVSGFTWQL